MAGRLRVILLAAALMAGVAMVGGPSLGSASAVLPSVAPVSGALGEFHPLSPARIYDTRGGGIGTTPGPKAMTPAGVSFDVQLLGVGGVPSNPSHVYAVMANITVISPTTQGYLAAYPKGEPRPLASNLNFMAGQVVPNMTVLRPGADGQSTMVLQGIADGQANVIVDVFGWVSTSANPDRGARLNSLRPGRIFDSRPGEPFAANESRAVRFRGVSGTGFVVPDDPAVVGAVLNVTGINNRPESIATYISVVPTAPGGPTSTSNLNLAPGVTRANLVIVPVGPDGNIHLYNAAGRTHIAVDVVGFLRNGETAERTGRIIPLRAPFRAADTRVGPNGPVRIGPGQAEEWDFYCSIASTTIDGQPIGRVGALLGNLTGTGFQQQYWNSPTITYLTMFPSAPLPTASNLNFGQGETVANMAVGRLLNTTESTPRTLVSVYNAQGFVHYLFDVSAMVLEDGTVPARSC